MSSQLHITEIENPNTENATTNKSKSKSRPKPPKSNQPLPLQFLTLTSLPSTQKSDFSTTVRSRAMQSFIRSKNQPEVEIVGDKSVKISAQTGKFKLSNWKRKARGEAKKETSRDEHIERVEAVELRVAADELVRFLRENSSGPMPLPIEIIYSQLPIPTDTRSQRLLYHYNTQFSMNAFAINYDNTYKTFSITDSALLHATLCLVAQHEDLLTDTKHESLDNLYHKGQAIQVMNKRLREGREVVSDADVTVVALLVVLETINGAYTSAHAHLTGLVQMISLHGGLASFTQNLVLLRTVAWSDIAFSERFFTPPLFISFFSSTAHSLISSALLNFPTVYKNWEGVLDTEDQRIVEVLRIISHVIDLRGVEMGDKKGVVDLMVAAEYRILELLTNPPQHNPPPPSYSPLSTIFKTTALIYINHTLRLLLPTSKIFSGLTSTILPSLYSTPFHAVRKGERGIWLWVLVVCAAVNREVLGILKKSLKIWVLKSVKEVKELLKSVVWREDFCGRMVGRVWEGVEGEL